MSNTEIKIRMQDEAITFRTESTESAESMQMILLEQLRLENEAFSQLTKEELADIREFMLHGVRLVNSHSTTP